MFVVFLFVFLIEFSFFNSFAEQKKITYDSMRIDKQKDIFFSGNVVVSSGDKTIKSNNLSVSNRGSSDEVISASGNVRFFDSSSLIFAKDLRYKTKDSSFQGSNLFFKDIQTNVSIYSANTFSDGDKKIIENTIFTGCVVQDSSVYKSILECFEREKEDDVKKKISWMPWSVSSKKVILDQEKGYATLNSAVLKIYNVPVFYMPYLKFPVGDKKKEGESGFLIPTIEFRRSQFGVSIPYYLRLGGNTDVLLYGNFYAPSVSGDSNEYRKLSSNFSVRFRHLFDSAFSSKVGFMRFSGMTTVLPSYYFDYSGNSKYGVRGFFNFGGIYWLGENTKIDFDVSDVSDRNLLTLYYTKFQNYIKNRIAIEHVSDDFLTTLEVLKFDSAFVPIEKSTTPTIYHAESVFKFNHKLFSEHANTEFKADFLRSDRDVGYSINRGLIEAKTTIPIYFSGYKMSFNNSLRGYIYNTNNNISSLNTVYPSANITNLSPSELYGNYDYLILRGLHSNTLNAGNYNSFNSITNIIVSHPLISKVGKNKIVINPKLGLINKAGYNSSTFFVNEDSIQSLTSEYNIMSPTKGAFDVVDLGTYSVYGVDVIHSGFKDYKSSFFIGGMNKIFKDSMSKNYNTFYSSNAYYAFSGNVSFKGLNLSSNAILDESYRLTRLVSSVGYGNKYFGFNFGYSDVNNNYMLSGFKLRFLTYDLFVNVYDFKMFYRELISLENDRSFININLSGSAIRSFGFLHDRGCVSYGFTYSTHNLFLPTGIGASSVMSFNFGLKFL